MRNMGPLHKAMVTAAIGALVLAGALLFMPRQAGMDPSEEVWIDRLVTFVTVQQITAIRSPSASFDLYFDQLARVRASVRTGDHPRAYAAMNRLMDMLEAREGGIAPEAADAIWDFCEQVTPAAYHDVSRHLRGRDRAGAAPLAPTHG